MTTGVSFSKRCSVCQKKSQHMKMTCKYCYKENICLNCLMPETHKCTNMVDCISENRGKCEESLLKNKCQKRKLEEI